MAACFQSLWAADERLALTGSSTVAPLALEIAKRFERQKPGVRIDVQTGGSSRGINDVRLGLADIGMVSRALKESEQDLSAYTIAMDGICIILHQSNSIESLTDNQIIDIYSGKITNWQESGGPDRPISVVNKAEGRSTLELFLHYFSLKNSQIKPRIIIGDNQQGIKTVAGNPGAIGYVSIGSAEYEQEHGAAIKRLPLAGEAATLTAVRNGHYPLARPLNLVIKGEGPALVKQFIDFARSSEVDDLVEAQYFVPLAH
ncbi:MAG: phosphate ABC transporter substrate-binding protein [Methylococcaceae bacterium]|nr:phosphate ABC transporter substrate-binding protein [Methylococcaceae bacterium]